jgi:hypothetical protein
MLKANTDLWLTYVRSTPTTGKGFDYWTLLWVDGKAEKMWVVNGDYDRNRNRAKDLGDKRDKDKNEHELQYKMAILDMAGSNVFVAGVGRRFAFASTTTLTYRVLMEKLDKEKEGF